MGYSPTDIHQRQVWAESVNSLEAAQRPLLSVEEPLAPNRSRIPRGATFNDFESEIARLPPLFGFAH